MVYKRTIERKLLDPQDRDVDFEKMFREADSVVRTAFNNLKGRKGYFCMRDLRPKKKIEFQM
jgi:hypothetical protein